MHTAKVMASVIVLLFLIIGISTYSANILKTTSKNLDGYVANIEESVKSGNWKEAKKQVSLVLDKWSETENTWAMLLDHFEIDNIDTALQRLSKYVETENHSAALAELAVLKQFINHIPDKDGLRIKNIL